MAERQGAPLGSCTVYPSALDPTHERAIRTVVRGDDVRAEVRHPNANGALVFECWRVTADSYAWRTSIMGAPAFARFSDEPVRLAQRYGKP